MKREDSRTANGKSRLEPWSSRYDGVVGDEKNIGFIRISEGSGFSQAGTVIKGAVLAIDWLVRDDLNSSVLLKTEDGRSTFVRTTGWDGAKSLASASFGFLDGPTYSSRDPILDAHSLAASFAWHCAGDPNEALAQILPIAKSFLAENYDQAVLGIEIGRPITGKEYHFLLQNPARRQAVLAMPWLLPDIVMNYGTQQVTEIMRIIDGQEELIPALCKRFGVEPNVIRSMSVFPAWSPKAFRLGELKAVDAATIALALSQMPPEQRPDKDRVFRFMEVIAWVETVLREAGDQASRTLVALATAEVWKRLRRRPYSLPSYHEVSWLFEMATAVKDFPSIDPKPAEGEACGTKKSYMPHVWAVAYCLCRYHPTDLAAIGREWNRREMAYVRHHVRESFPATFPIDSCFPDAFDATNGWKVRRIATVGQLCDESAAASNCLAGYLASLIRRDAAIYCLLDQNGNAEGHFSLEPGESDELAIGQVKRYRNRKATPQMKAAANEFLELMRKEKGRDYPPPLNMRAAAKAGMRLAVTAVDGAKTIAHKKFVEEILIKTAERFSINRS